MNKDKLDKIDLDEQEKDKGNERDNFKENVIEDLPQVNPKEMIRPIGNLNKKVGKAAVNKLKNKRAAEKNKMAKRRLKNRIARKTRKKNRRK